MIELTQLTGYQDGRYDLISNIGPSILDFGFIHSDATYDVMPVYNKRAFCFDRHMSRFKESAKYFGFDFPKDDLIEIASSLIHKNQLRDAFVWFMLWRGAPPSGNPRDISGCPTHFAMYAKPSYPLYNKNEISVYLDKQSLRVEDRFYNQKYKNMAWIEFTRSQRLVPSGYDTTVLVDSRDCLAEGPGFNVAVVLKGAVYTPYRNCLRGITMSVVEDIAQENLIPFIKTDVSVDYWYAADEIFLTSSSGGISIVKVGPITEKIKNEYEKKKTDIRYSKEL